LKITYLIVALELFNVLGELFGAVLVVLELLLEVLGFHLFLAKISLETQVLRKEESDLVPFREHSSQEI
jgi:hypothetical protein